MHNTNNIRFFIMYTPHIFKIFLKSELVSLLCSEGASFHGVEHTLRGQFSCPGKKIDK